MFKGPVPGFFGLIGKTTSGQLAALQVVSQAFTADSLAGTGIICAVTAIHIFFFAAFHRRRLHLGISYIFPLVANMKD
jgi:hypothetical protein